MAIKANTNCFADILLNSEKDPHPCPPPEYQERGKRVGLAEDFGRAITNLIRIIEISIALQLWLVEGELVESSVHRFIQKEFVGKSEERVPVALDHAVGAVGPTDAETIGRVE